MPFFFGSPFYSAFKRVVIEIAKNRTNPHLVPGIEAMLPDSPMARLLRDAPVRAGMDMAVIAGDIEGHAGPGSTHTPIVMLHATLAPGAQLQLPWNRAFNGLVYALSGSGTVGAEHHPLEAAQLAGTSAANVQADRLETARQLAERFACVVVLKGSGTVIAAPSQPLMLNASGNALLATAGTGDVLAGMVGARLAGGMNGFDAACSAVFAHGRRADTWAADKPHQALTASALAQWQGV